MTTHRIASASAVLAIALLGSSAFAQQAGSQPLSRATVQAGIAQARVSGELGQIDGDTSTAPVAVSARSRSDVKAEVIADQNARKRNDVTESDGFEEPGPAQPVVASTKTRAEVKAELLAAIHRGAKLDDDDSY